MVKLITGTAWKILVWVIILLGISYMLSAQNDFEGYEYLFHPVRNYVVYKTNESIKIDGKATEKCWIDADWSGGFLDIEGAHKPQPLLETRFKMLWDDKNIYFFFELEEPHIWATYSNHDQIVFHENDVEIFIDPDRNAIDYFEFEFNAKNTLFDLFMPLSYRNGGKPLMTWNAPGLKSAVSINGTLNNPEDKDESWTLELAIPFYSLKAGMRSVRPDEGSTWKINFSRVQWQIEAEKGVYIKKIDPETGKHYPEYNWVWSPQGVINMHLPERWGMIQFSTHPPGEKKTNFLMPPDEELMKYLWLIYYKQRDFISKHGKYAATLENLGIKKKYTTVADEEIEIEIDAAKSSYRIILSKGENVKYAIDNRGQISKIGTLKRQ